MAGRNRAPAATQPWPVVRLLAGAHENGPTGHGGANQGHMEIVGMKVTSPWCLTRPEKEASEVMDMAGGEKSSAVQVKLALEATIHLEICMG